ATSVPVVSGRDEQTGGRSVGATRGTGCGVEGSRSTAVIDGRPAPARWPRVRGNGKGGSDDQGCEAGVGGGRRQVLVVGTPGRRPIPRNGIRRGARRRRRGTRNEARGERADR